MSKLLLLVLFSIGLIAAPAQADTPGCVSHAEFDNMIRGLSTSQVAGRFDTSGSYDGSSEDNFRRTYNACWTGSREVVVRYSLTSGVSVSWDVRDI